MSVLRRVLAPLVRRLSKLLYVLPLPCGFRGGFLAPLVLEVAALWQPPAAKEGQGDCDFPLGPPWILLYPLKRRRSAGGWRRQGGAFLRGALALGRFLCGVTARCLRGWGRADAACVGLGVLGRACGARGHWRWGAEVRWRWGALVLESAGGGAWGESALAVGCGVGMGVLCWRCVKCLTHKLNGVIIQLSE